MSRGLRRSGAEYFGLLLAALALAACSPAPEALNAPASKPALSQPVKLAGDEFSVMSWNLDRFCFDDRNKDAQANEFKPEAEVQAVLETIATEKPDVLACQEVGDGPAFERLRDELKKRGLEFPHAEQLAIAGNASHLAILSRHPILSTTRVTNESYTIQGRTYPVQHGFLVAEIEVDNRYRFKLLTAQLRTKGFAEAGQTEMRRNEARLLNKTVRHLLAADTTNQNLVVAGDLSDDPRSATLGETIGKTQRVLTDIRLLDSNNDSWTHHDAEADSYERIDYILPTADMAPEIVTQKCHIISGPQILRASSHRPLTAVFRTRDL